MIQLHGNPQSPEHHGANLEQAEGSLMPNCFAFTQARPAVCSQFKVSNTATQWTSQQSLPDSTLQHTGCSHPSAWIATFHRPILSKLQHLHPGSTTPSFHVFFSSSGTYSWFFHGDLSSLYFCFFVFLTSESADGFKLQTLQTWSQMVSIHVGLPSFENRDILDSNT